MSFSQIVVLKNTVYTFSSLQDLISSLSYYSSGFQLPLLPSLILALFLFSRKSSPPCVIHLLSRLDYHSLSSVSVFVLSSLKKQSLYLLFPMRSYFKTSSTLTSSRSFSFPSKLFSNANQVFNSFSKDKFLSVISQGNLWNSIAKFWCQKGTV